MLTRTQVTSFSSYQEDYDAKPICYGQNRPISVTLEKIEVKDTVRWQLFSVTYCSGYDINALFSPKIMIANAQKEIGAAKKRMKEFPLFAVEKQKAIDREECLVQAATNFRITVLQNNMVSEAECDSVRYTIRNTRKSPLHPEQVDLSTIVVCYQDLENTQRSYVSPTLSGHYIPNAQYLAAEHERIKQISKDYEESKKPVCALGHQQNKAMALVAPQPKASKELKTPQEPKASPPELPPETQKPRTVWAQCSDQ